jgi:hypothetical protein
VTRDRAAFSKCDSVGCAAFPYREVNASFGARWSGTLKMPAAFRLGRRGDAVRMAIRAAMASRSYSPPANARNPFGPGGGLATALQVPCTASTRADCQPAAGCHPAPHPAGASSSVSAPSPNLMRSHAAHIRQRPRQPAQPSRAWDLLAPPPACVVHIHPAVAFRQE